MSPTVAPAAQVRRRERPSGESVVGTSAIRRPRSVALTTISLANSMPGVCRLERSDRVAAEAAQAAMEVADRAAEEQPAEPGQHGVAEIPVQRRHGAGRDAALEAVAHDEIVAFPKPLDEGVEAGEVVAVVGVAHDDDSGRARPRCRRRGGAVAALGNSDDAGTEALGDLWRAVGAAIVGDEHLARDAGALEIARRLS